ncbi:MoaD family protein [Campylobacterota bacterium]|nr:MoaD family protein [Campylobacterota bacterium]
MSVIIQVPTALRAFTERQADIAVEASTVAEALSALAVAQPAIKQHLYDENGVLRTFINVFVGDTNIKQLQGVETKLEPNAVLMLIPAIAGGNNV